MSPPPEPPTAPPEGASSPPARAYHAFDDPVQDRFLGIVLALGAEVWQLRDRLGLLESALARKGIDVADLIDELALDPERAPSMATDRDAFLARFLRAVSADGAGNE